jgi:RND family efflux transporter MFP subunit
MKRYIIATLIIVVLFFAFGFYKLKQRKMEYAKLPPPQRASYIVEAAKPQKGTLKEFTLFRGFYEPLTKGVLSPKTSGVVKKLLVHEGDKFKKGQILAVVDPYELKNKIASQKAKIEALKAKVEALKVAYETQKAIYERDKKLYETGGISKEQFQISKTRFENAKANLKGATAELKGAQKQLEILKHNLEQYTYIRAPYDGVVRKLFAREGDFVGPGKPILGLERTDQYRILVEVSKDTPVGKEAYITVNGKEIKATVSRVFPSADKNLKIVEIPVQKLDIPSESWVDVKLETKTCRGFIIPFASILYLDSGTFVVDTNKNLIPVKIGAINDGKACVKGKLSETEKVLIAGQFRLREIALHKWPIKVEIQ